MENNKRKLTIEDFLTIPNLMSVFRILLIPVIIRFYIYDKDYKAAFITILVSALSDIVDGWIARTFNMTSDFGKLIDPIADRLTQASFMICLASRFESMWLMFSIDAICQIIQLYFGIWMKKEIDKVHSAKWHGKLNSFIVEATLVALLVFTSIPESIANLLIIICDVSMVINCIMYVQFFTAQVKKESIDKGSK